MLALGLPIVRQLRRMANAYQEGAGAPSIDSTEVIGAYEAERAGRTITRRELLRRGGLVAAGAFAATSLGIARAPGAAAARDASVVVIGAGLAGLSCVYRLHRHGIAATLYEAHTPADEKRGRFGEIHGARTLDAAGGRHFTELGNMGLLRSAPFRAMR